MKAEVSILQPDTTWTGNFRQARAEVCSDNCMHCIYLAMLLGMAITRSCLLRELVVLFKTAPLVFANDTWPLALVPSECCAALVLENDV